MSNENYIKKQTIYSLIFILIGLTSGISGFVFNFQKNLMIGITAGFLPTGILSLIIYNYAKKKPEMIKNIEIENEERNVFINTKSGYTAFWATYLYIFAGFILSNIIEITLSQFLIITILFMPVVYFSFLIVYHKKY